MPGIFNALFGPSILQEVFSCLRNMVSSKSSFRPARTKTKIINCANTDKICLISTVKPILTATSKQRPPANNGQPKAERAATYVQLPLF